MPRFPRRPMRAFFGALLPLLLLSCGGDSADSDAASPLQLSGDSFAFRAFPWEQTGEWRTVEVSWSGPPIARINVLTAPGHERPGWLATSLSLTPPWEFDVIRASLGSVPAPGTTQTGVLRVYALREGWEPAGDNVAAYRDVTVTLEVLAEPAISPSSVALAWTAGAEPGTSQLSIARDPRVAIAGVQVDAEWVSVAASGDAITLSGNAASRALAAGTYGATLTATFTLDGCSREVQVPVSAQVSSGIAGGTQL